MVGLPPTTLDEHFARYGVADADRLFPHGLADPFAMLIADWLAAIREGRPSDRWSWP